MSLRTLCKRLLYQARPGRHGAFPYYGVRTYFPKNSFVFRLACEHGIYEATNLRLLFSALRPGTTVFDVGANIGLMSIPLLSDAAGVRVVSVEPSPRNHAALARTVAESIHRSRWELLACALGAQAGETTFHCARPEWGAFDGLRDTGRVGQTEAVQVQVRTLDELWEERGRPDVCAVKIDVEGADLDVLRGATVCLRACRPLVLVEWNAENLAAFGHDKAALLTFAQSVGCDLFAMPGLVLTASPDHLRAQMQFEESFVLLPATDRVLIGSA